jgi:hypothetical protein
LIASPSIIAAHSARRSSRLRVPGFRPARFRPFVLALPFFRLFAGFSAFPRKPAWIQ